MGDFCAWDGNVLKNKKHPKTKAPITNHNYDLICIDTYVGDTFPDKFESEEFIKNIKELLEPGGMRVNISTDRTRRQAVAQRPANRLVHHRVHQSPRVLVENLLVSAKDAYSNRLFFPGLARPKRLRERIHFGGFELHEFLPELLVKLPHLRRREA